MTRLAAPSHSFVCPAKGCGHVERDVQIAHPQHGHQVGGRWKWVPMVALDPQATTTTEDSPS